MSGLREAFDEIVADVPVYGDLDRAVERAERERRHRFGVFAGVAAAAAVVVVAVVAATGVLGGGDQASPTVPPISSPSSSPTAEDYELPPTNYEAFGAKLDAIVSDVPGWRLDEDAGYDDYAFNGRCANLVTWADASVAGSDAGPPPPPSGRTLFSMGVASFASREQASEAMVELVARLESCTTTAWQTRTIPGTGAVLAMSRTTVAWIQQWNVDVRLLQAPTTGTPPPDVQVAVAEWLADYMAMPNEELHALVEGQDD